MANSAQKRGEPVRLPSLGYLSLSTGRRLGLEFVFGTCLLIVAVFVFVKDYAGDARRPAITSTRARAAGAAIQFTKIGCTKIKIIPFIGDVIPHP